MATDVSGQIVAALIGAGAGVATLGLTLWRQEAGRRAADSDSRRKECSQIVGRVVELAFEAANLLSFDDRTVRERHLLALRCRYERFPEIQKDLILLMGWHPSDEVSKMCPELEGLLEKHLEEVEKRLREMPQEGTERGHMPATAATAQAVSRQLLNKIRRYDLHRWRDRIVAGMHRTIELGRRTAGLFPY